MLNYRGEDLGRYMCGRAVATEPGRSTLDHAIAEIRVVRFQGELVPVNENAIALTVDRHRDARLAR